MSEASALGVSERCLEDDRVQTIGRQERERPIGRQVTLAVGEPHGAIPSTDPFQEVVEVIVSERSGFVQGRFSESELAGARLC